MIIIIAIIIKITISNDVSKDFPVCCSNLYSTDTRRTSVQEIKSQDYPVMLTHDLNVRGKQSLPMVLRIQQWSPLHIFVSLKRKSMNN